MSRVNTVVFSLPSEVDRPKAIEIHRFLKTTVNLSPTEVLCIQLDASVKRFFVKLDSAERCEAVVSRNSGEYPLKLTDGSDVVVVARHASGLGRRVVRVFDIPFEAPNSSIHAALSPYGQIISIQMEKWSFDGYFNCPNGTRQVIIDLDKRHVPSFVSIGEFGKVMTAYNDQPATCAHCDARGHSRADCPNKRRTRGWESLSKQSSKHTPQSVLARGIPESTVLPVKVVNQSRYRPSTPLKVSSQASPRAVGAKGTDKSASSSSEVTLPVNKLVLGAPTSTPSTSSATPGSGPAAPTPEVPAHSVVQGSALSTPKVLTPVSQPAQEESGKSPAPKVTSSTTDMSRSSSQTEKPESFSQSDLSSGKHDSASSCSVQSKPQSWNEQMEENETRSNLIHLGEFFKDGPPPAQDLKRARPQSRSPSPSSRKQRSLSQLSSGSGNDSGDSS